MSGWKTSVCATNGIKISYTRTGESKPALVLLHGLTANGACWSGVSRLLENKYDIIMPNARGHGESSAPECGYTYEDHASDVTGLLNALKLSSVILIGHSMGGMTAALVAMLGSKLLRGLILADPTFLSTKVQQEVYNSDVREQHRRMLDQSLEKLIADLQSRHPNRSHETIELIAKARLQTSISAFDVLTPPSPDYKKLVSAIDVPALLVFGDKGVVSSAVAKELQELNPLLQVEQMQDVGHGLHYDQPELFASIVASFMHSI